MDLIDKIHDLAAKIPKQRGHLSTEEATKNALVMPFINALGYNVFDPTEVVPEFTADVGTKKREKVDYAIMKDGNPIILFEVKCCGVNLSETHASQLYRYFSVTDARFGILTDGIIYHLYSDLESPNKMDEKPFLVFDLMNFDDALVSELKKFTKLTFDVDSILSTANELKYGREIQNLIAAEYNNPSEDFVRHFAGQVYSRRLMQSVVEDFGEITKQAFRSFVNKKVEDRLKSALDTESSSVEELASVSEQTAESQPEARKKGGVVTTQEELDGYYVVKAILRENIDPVRVAMRDVKSYCSIVLDDSNRKPICRFRFNTAQKYLGLFDVDKNEERIPIDRIDDIYQYADRLKTTAASYNE